jgi:hypothetical protein
VDDRLRLLLERERPYYARASRTRLSLARRRGIYDRPTECERRVVGFFDGYLLDRNG